MPSKVMSSDSPRKCAGALALPWFPSRPAAKGTQRFAFGDWQGYYASRFADVYESWPLDTANLFLSPRFLASEEEGLPALLRPRYLVLENDRGPFAWVALQVVTFRALDNIRDQEVWKGLWGKTKRFFARFGNYRILICGHLFIPGEHVWHVQGTEPTRQAFLRQLGPMLKRIARHEGASVVLCKDFEEPLPFAAEGGLHELSFQPNMIFDLRPQWKTVDDYLDAMSSKYRIRARRAFKKSEGLLFKELSFGQIELLAGELAMLYRDIVEAAGFSLVCAGPEYFVELKRSLGPDFQVTACYMGDTLAGFYSTIRNGGDLEAHFIGFLPELNRSHQIYLNMLYRMVEQGIHARMNRIVFARTAMEIKSSIGAVARPARVYLAHVNPFLNFLLPHVVRLVEPKEEWTPRHPFREEGEG
ncbi:MAG: GNAT family N-acetyltransferase [Haliscomenobacter sp.]|nr:GNAT family N-acetyltransferase [Haliscomenobacter sp.]